MEDRFNLNRFLEAQEGVIDSALSELRAGRKTSHWMWFVLPQIAGLGRSATAQFYAISGLAEARAYLAHPVLGRRLLECVKAVNDLSGLTAQAMFGFPDVLKFRSCLTLFAAVAPSQSPFRLALERYYDGIGDAETMTILERQGAAGA